MFKLSAIIKKALLVVMILGIGFAALPTANVYAAGAKDETEPPVRTEVHAILLGRVWARELAFYERQSKLLENADTLIERVQSLIDKATGKGLDASTLQAALDPFQIAVQDARPIHQSAKGIVTSHKGFDENGNVTDSVQAKETVRELGQHLRDFRTAMDGTGKELWKALKAYFEANRPHRDDRP